MVLYDFEESLDHGGVDNCGGGYGRSFDNWSQIAESTLPLKASKLASFNQGQFRSAIEVRSRQISTKVIVVNLIALLVNLLLAVIAFYFSFTNDSTATTAFAADCLLDLISSAIILWRYYGDLSSVYMHAREQIACIYLGALFELSAIGIIIKSISDIATPDPALETEFEASYELVYLAAAATLACSVLTVFKCALFKTLRDNSILLDVINTVISTVFAMSIVMSQVLINVNPSFWYLDPVLSIVLALFMMGFGIKVIHENFNVLKPVYYGSHSNDRSQRNLGDQGSALILIDRKNRPTLEDNPPTANQMTTSSTNKNYGSNLTTCELDGQKHQPANWQKTDYSSITFH